MYLDIFAPLKLATGTTTPFTKRLPVHCFPYQSWLS